MKKLWLSIGCYFLSLSVLAEENCTALQPQGLSPQNIPAEAGCSCLKANKHEAAGTYVFKQQVFDNKTDLVILEPATSPQAEVRRVTFGRGDANSNCYFQPLAFAQGGGWGWHMLWAESLSHPQTVGLYYARMDGEAWVSSNPKCLSKFAPINPQFKLDKEMITVTWQQIENGVTANMQAISSDEGRSWDIGLSQ
jgi:hypothetical protein